MIPITEVLLSHEFTQVPASWVRPQGTYINATGFTFPLPEGRSKDKKNINRMLEQINLPPSSAGVHFRLRIEHPQEDSKAPRFSF